MKLFAAPILVALATSSAFAQQFPCDNATSGAYGGGWTTGTNGGFGFTPWTLSTQFNDPAKGGHFRATSNGNGAGGGPGIDIFGHAWGMYANNGETSKAERGFLATVVTGDTISFDLDTGYIDNGSEVSVAFFNGANEAWRVGFTGGANAYTMADAGGTTSTGLPFTDGGLHVDFKLTGGGAYTATVKRLADNSVFVGSGVMANSLTTITSFEFLNRNAGSGSQHDAFFNEICVVPEPATILALGGLLLAARRRRD